MTETEYQREPADWLHVGAKVAVITYGRYGTTPHAAMTTVTKLTKQDIVLANGERFRHSGKQTACGGTETTYSARRDGTWGHIEYLYRADASIVTDAVKAARLTMLRSEVAHAVHEVERDLNQDTAQAAINALAAWMGEQAAQEAEKTP